MVILALGTHRYKTWIFRSLWLSGTFLLSHKAGVLMPHTELDIIPEDLGGVTFLIKHFLPPAGPGPGLAPTSNSVPLDPSDSLQAAAWDSEPRAFSSHGRMITVFVLSIRVSWDRLHFCSIPFHTISCGVSRTRLSCLTDFPWKLQGGRWPLGGRTRTTRALIAYHRCSVKPLGPAWPGAFSQADPLPGTLPCLLQYFCANEIIKWNSNGWNKAKFSCPGWSRGEVRAAVLPGFSLTPEAAPRHRHRTQGLLDTWPDDLWFNLNLQWGTWGTERG